MINQETESKTIRSKGSTFSTCAKKLFRCLLGFNPFQTVAKCCKSLQQKTLGHMTEGFKWVQGQDLNLGPSGYEPDELPDCSTLQKMVMFKKSKTVPANQQLTVSIGSSDRQRQKRFDHSTELESKVRE